MNIRFDSSESETLLVCECGWRHMQTNAQAAWRAAHRHCLALHPGDFQMRDQLQRRKKYALASC